MKPLLISSGEPAGVGPDLCLALAALQLPVVILGDKALLAQRAKTLNIEVQFCDYRQDHSVATEPGKLTVLSLPCIDSVEAGKLNPNNSPYVLKMLQLAAQKCMEREFAALVTAPVHKAVINEAGFTFTGHTEFLAEYCQTETVVMMLACQAMRVALLTTHLPLRDVPNAITADLIHKVVRQIYQSLRDDFAIENPKIFVAGLNPHAGEGGYLGREEIEIINPALEALRKEGIHIQGAFPADTLFTPKHLQTCDAFLAMYHDQGLPVIKYADFSSAVNVTLGLPIIRTSVDHGTALELAGTGLADPSSLEAAVKMAEEMARNREENNAH
nr:4-hydroxythreonine-4-phosphate dehydrogenase PdxA [Legionella jordanis]